jgi:thymidylate kinase
MIIILEGVNRVGKTTLAQYLQNKYNITYFNDRCFIDNTRSDVSRVMQDIKTATIANFNLLKCLKEDIIVDRFHLTEFVYGYMDRNYYAGYFYDLDAELSKIGAKLILLTDDISEINKRASRNMIQHFTMMNNAFDASLMNKIKYNLGKDDLNKLVEWLGLKPNETKSYEEEQIAIIN